MPGQMSLNVTTLPRYRLKVPGCRHLVPWSMAAVSGPVPGFRHLVTSSWICSGINLIIYIKIPANVAIFIYVHHYIITGSIWHVFSDYIFCIKLMKLININRIEIQQYSIYVALKSGIYLNLIIINRIFLTTLDVN